MKVLKKQANSKDCFVCGTENPYGIHANFYNMEDLSCVALFQFDSKHQSYPERTHGGNITSIIDETIGRAVWCIDENIWGCTIKLNMQYKKPVPYETPLMCVGKIDTFPINKRTFNIEEITASDNIVGQLYPEIFSCVGCNACTKGCPQGLKVMQYIAYAQRGEYEKAAETSFDCVGCNICASRCPAQISHSAVGLLCRRLTAKFIAPKCEHLANRVAEIENGNFDELIAKLKNMPLDEIKDLYNKRDIEK